jgi:K+-transporting ATPase A subunit
MADITIQNLLYTAKGICIEIRVMRSITHNSAEDIFLS